MIEKRFLLVLLLVISALFVAVIRPFLVSLTMAALFTAVLQPAYDWLLPRMRGRENLTAAAILLAVMLVVVLPLVLFLGMATSQAAGISQQVRPWLAEQVAARDQIPQRLVERFPILERLRPYQAQITARAAEMAGKAGAYLASSLSAAAGGTASFLFQLVVMLYAMFCFLIDGRAILGRALGYMPLPQQDKDRLTSRFVSVTRAMLKGTFVVGLIQGALAGLGFAVAGIEGAVFWGTVMAVCAFVPGIGSGIVWAPAVIYLALTGRTIAAIALAAWCAAIVGSVDNILRPRLVGRGADMPALLIFLGTLGGLLLFGMVGILLGPIIAALFLSVWEMYGHIISGAIPPRPGVPGGKQAPAKPGPGSTAGA
jgi:predicted PurR-regulated permease PerM